MKSIAASAYLVRATCLFAPLLLVGCANMGTSVGINIPIGGFGGVGVSIGSDGRVGGTVGVGAGGVSVGVGTSGQLPPATKPEEEKKP
jgi:hypothetical protein